MSKRLSTLFFDALENPSSRSFESTNNFLAFITLVATLSLILETVPSLSSYATYFNWIEWVSVAFFTAEYIARIAYAKKKVAYIFSFFGLVDLLSILPTFLAISNLTFLKTVRGLRILRFLRMVRLAKVARHHVRTGEHSLYVINTQLYLFSLIIALLTIGTLLYIVEGPTSAAHDIPSGMLWALLIILGDVPYPSPITDAGTYIMILGRFAGLVLLGLLVGLIIPIVRNILTGSSNESAVKNVHTE